VFKRGFVDVMIDAVGGEKTLQLALCRGDCVGSHSAS